MAKAPEYSPRDSGPELESGTELDLAPEPAPAPDVATAGPGSALVTP